MYFAGNKARVGPVMFVSNLAACEWYSIDSSRYFEPDNLKRWEKIVKIRLVCVYVYICVLTMYVAMAQNLEVEKFPKYFW